MANEIEAKIRAALGVDEGSDDAESSKEGLESAIEASLAGKVDPESDA